VKIRSPVWPTAFRGTALLEAIDAAITAAKHKVEQDSAAAGRFA